MPKRIGDRVEAVRVALASIDDEGEASAPPMRRALVQYMIELPERARQDREKLLAEATGSMGPCPSAPWTRHVSMLQIGQTVIQLHLRHQSIWLSKRRSDLREGTSSRSKYGRSRQRCRCRR